MNNIDLSRVTISVGSYTAVLGGHDSNNENVDLSKKDARALAAGFRTMSEALTEGETPLVTIENDADLDLYIVAEKEMDRYECEEVNVRLYVGRDGVAKRLFLTDEECNDDGSFYGDSMKYDLDRLAASVESIVDYVEVDEVTWRTGDYGLEAEFDPRSGKFHIAMRESFNATVTLPKSLYASMRSALRYGSFGGAFYANANEGIVIMADETARRVNIMLLNGTSSPWLVLDMEGSSWARLVEVIEKAMASA